MKNFSEKTYNIFNKEDIKNIIEISEQDLKTLEIIAKRIGGDFGMSIKLGNIGEGSFFNPQDNSIIFDPLHIKENPDLAKFVAAHEGSHRAITLNPIDIGLTLDEVEEHYSQIGFGYLQNVIEDPAVNDWMRKKFPGLNEYVKKFYDEQFKKENVVLSTPEVQRIAFQLGYWPKFSQYGSEIIRYWHEKRFSRKLDPAVEKALKRTINYAEESIISIPDPDKNIRDRKEIIFYAQKRFENNTNWIWPEVKKLVEMDLHTEEIRQMLKEFIQKQKKLEQKKIELKQAKQKNNKQKEETIQREIDALEKELAPFDVLPENIKKEIKRQIDEAVREISEKLNQEINEKEKQIEEFKQRQEELGKEIKDLEEKIKRLKDEEKKELEKKLQEKKLEKLEQKLKQEKFEEELKNIKDCLRKIQSGEEIPYPEDKISEEIKEELKKFKEKLPNEKKQELREKAEEQLERFEDILNQEMGGKLNENKVKSHQEIRKEKQIKNELENQRKKTENERIELKNELERMRKEKMTEYDKVYEEVADIINSLYNKLKRIFLPERHPRWQKGYTTGSRIDLDKAMQSEADPRYLDKIWERKTIPHKFDYRFSILVDISRSMKGEKIKETFKGVVILAEVLEKLGIQYEIISFNNFSNILKQWSEKLNQENRNRLSKIKDSVNGGTNTTEATENAYKRFLENLGKNNFLLTLTDGEPDDSESLNQVLNNIKKEGKIKLIGIGLGPRTEFVKKFYKAAFSIPQIKITEDERRMGKKDFIDIFSEILEDMIKHPEKY